MGRPPQPERLLSHDREVIDVILGIALIVVSGFAQVYRNQRDNLAAAWMYFHPEDFPSLQEKEEDESDS